MQVNIKHGYWTYQGSVSDIGEVTNVKVFNGREPYVSSEEELTEIQDLLFSASKGSRFAGMTVTLT
jgi:hypothetical protein